MYIDHDAAIEISKQISIITTFMNKLNLRLIKAFDYIQRFDLKLRHKSNKTHIMSDALFRLINNNIIDASSNEELNVLFITAIIDLDEVFRKKILNNYNTGLN